jgi:hypothetical protein
MSLPFNDFGFFLGSESITYHSGTDHITIEPPGMEFSTICAYAKVVLIYFTQCCGSGSRLDPDSMGSLDPDGLEPSPCVSCVLDP